MNNEILKKLSSVIDVLGNIEVKGKTNLLNLGGCIAVLEEIRHDCVANPNASNNEKSNEER